MKVKCNACGLEATLDECGDSVICPCCGSSDLNVNPYK